MGQISSQEAEDVDFETECFRAAEALVGPDEWGRRLAVIELVMLRNSVCASNLHSAASCAPRAVLGAVAESLAEYSKFVSSMSPDMSLENGDDVEPLLLSLARAAHARGCSLLWSHQCTNVSAC